MSVKIILALSLFCLILTRSTCLYLWPNFMLNKNDSSKLNYLCETDGTICFKEPANCLAWNSPSPCNIVAVLTRYMHGLTVIDPNEYEKIINGQVKHFLSEHPNIGLFLFNKMDLDIEGFDSIAAFLGQSSDPVLGDYIYMCSGTKEDGKVKVVSSVWASDSMAQPDHSSKEFQDEEDYNIVQDYYSCAFGLTMTADDDRTDISRRSGLHLSLAKVDSKTLRPREISFEYL